MMNDPTHPSEETPCVESIAIGRLRRHEQIDFDQANALLQALTSEGVWTAPLLVERHSNVILDGHHRFWCAYQLYLTAVPVIRIEYSDPDLTLETWRPDLPVTIEDVLMAANTGALMPYKTSRHRLSRSLPNCSIPLSDLRGPQQSNVAA